MFANVRALAPQIRTFVVAVLIAFVTGCSGLDPAKYDADVSAVGPVRLGEPVSQVRHDLGSGTPATKSELGFGSDVSIEVYRIDTALLAVYERRGSVSGVEFCQRCAEPHNDAFSYRDPHAEPKRITTNARTMAWLGSPVFAGAEPSAPPHWNRSHEPRGDSTIGTSEYSRDGAPFVALRMVGPRTGVTVVVEPLLAN